MKRIVFLFLLLLPSLQLVAQEEEFDGQSCTSIMVGKFATTDASVITSHTCDGRYRTWMRVEPAANHGAGETVKIYKGTAHTATPDDTTGVRLAGEIPQVAHTYAYLNTAYPCLNEKQLAIGESTFTGPEQLRNPDAMFLIEELERIALQRCTRAREAILLIADLIKQYGYADGGECLTIADKQEVWQMEIIGAGRNVIGGAWVAKRVPDDHVAVSANIPRIGLLLRNDPANFLCSDNVEQVAKTHGLWDGRGDFLFWKAFAPDYAKGRNFREREWFIFNALAPSQHLSYSATELPFSVRPDKKVSVEQVIELFRSTYEGTNMDMCRNLQMEVTRKDSLGIERTKYEPSTVANPWMTTAMQKTLNYLRPGTVEFQRTVSVAWCSYSFVTQLRGNQPDAVGGICWMSVDNPGQSPRIPIFCGTTKLPAAFARCGQKNYDPEAVLWQYRKANKLATVAWQRTKDDMMKEVLAQQKEAFDGLKKLERDVQIYDTQGMIVHSQKLVTDYTDKIYRATAAAWQRLEGKYWLLFGLGF